jgi:hypothetical protein
VSRILHSIDRRANASSRRQIERHDADTISPAKKIVSGANFGGAVAMQDVFMREEKVFPRHDFAVAMRAIFIARESGKFVCNVSR